MARGIGPDAARPAERSHIWDIFDQQPWAMTALLETLASWGITSDMLLVFALEIIAQLVDGALGMAFGIVSSTGLMTLGLSPAAASAVVHTAEIATTGASGASHAWFRNVDWRLFRRLAISGMVGGALGALVLSQVDGKAIQPFVAAYLTRHGIHHPDADVRMMPVEDAEPDYAPPLGLIGGFLDAVDGSGCGPMVTSTLVGSGRCAAPGHRDGQRGGVLRDVHDCRCVLQPAWSVRYRPYRCAGGGRACWRRRSGRSSPVVSTRGRQMFAVGVLVTALAGLQLWRVSFADGAMPPISRTARSEQRCRE